MWGTIQNVKVIKKQAILVTLGFFQGISYSNELKLGFITVQSEWTTNKNTIHSLFVCLMRAILKEPNRQQTPGFLRFKMNQLCQIIVFIIMITLLSEAACQSSTFNITEYNRHKKANGFSECSISYQLLLWGILQVESTGW